MTVEKYSPYEHIIQGGIPHPQRQYKINSAAIKEISETIKVSRSTQDKGNEETRSFFQHFIHERRRHNT